MKKTFDTPLFGTRTIRELKLLRYLRHDNILPTRILLPRAREGFDHIYTVAPLVQTDLHKFLKSSIEFGLDEIKFMTFQLISALDYIHKSQVIHRDIKPRNILISQKVGVSNAQLHVQICDFGLARMFFNADIDQEPNLSMEVVTRSYRPPELFLGNSSYTEKIDIWSLGCVIAEFFTRKKLFASENSKEILENIIKMVSEIDPNDLEFIEDPNAVDYIESIPRDKNGELGLLLSGTLATKQGI